MRAGILLPPATAQTIALALHELATNAAKYGALSNDPGRVDLTWRIELGKLEFVWVELDGPKIAPPNRRGYGSRAIVAGIERQLGGIVNSTGRSRRPALHFIRAARRQ